MGKLFYVWDRRSIVGNCALFWAKGSLDYVCDLRDAQLFTEEEARAIAGSRGTDVAVPQEVAEAIACHHVRSDGALQRALDAYDAKAKADAESSP